MDNLEYDLNRDTLKSIEEYKNGDVEVFDSVEEALEALDRD
ncbi:hypothetical protein [Lentilactobacillus senioris]|nr:hypothetical protein [Lentilactobacillus senioris]